MTRKKEAGQALVFGVLVLGIVLMGFAGLGIDIGVMRYDKRLQQTAADAAAIAGASNISSGGVTTGAKAASASDGFTDGSNNVTVTVNNGPTSGPHNGDTNYVEVLVAAIQPTYFMKVLGISTQTVTARAVATDLTSGIQSGCLYTLGPPAATIQGININGSATLDATSCGIVDNGNFDPTGGALTVKAGTFGVAGACNGSGCGKGSVTCADQSAANCPAYGTPAGANPLASMTPPCSPCTGGPNQMFTGNGTSNISPGTYSSITLTGNGAKSFAPGTYIFTGTGLTCMGTPPITGTGVTFYFANSSTFTCSGNDHITLTAPSSGTYSGILIYQNPSDTAGPSFGGNTGSSYNGIIYVPGAQVTFFGTASAVSAGIVIADSFALSGTPTVTLSGLSGITPPTSFVKNAVLVE